MCDAKQFFVRCANIGVASMQSSTGLPHKADHDGDP